MAIPVFSKIYQQKDCSVNISGRKIGGFMDGSSILVRFDGGEVAKTEGTDGPGLNRATAQGGTLEFTIRENSGDYQFLYGLFIAQSASGLTTAATFSSGSKVLFTFMDAILSLPGEMNTGDKKAAGVKFTLISRAIIPVDVGLIQGLSDSAQSTFA